MTFKFASLHGVPSFPVWKHFLTLLPDNSRSWHVTMRPFRCFLHNGQVSCRWSFNLNYLVYQLFTEKWCHYYFFVKNVQFYHKIKHIVLQIFCMTSQMTIRFGGKWRILKIVKGDNPNRACVAIKGRPVDRAPRRWRWYFFLTFFGNTFDENVDIFWEHLWWKFVLLFSGRRSQKIASRSRAPTREGGRRRCKRGEHVPSSPLKTPLGKVFQKLWIP